MQHPAQSKQRCRHPDFTPSPPALLCLNGIKLNLLHSWCIFRCCAYTCMQTHKHAVWSLLVTPQCKCNEAMQVHVNEQKCFCCVREGSHPQLSLFQTISGLKGHHPVGVEVFTAGRSNQGWPQILWIQLTQDDWSVPRSTISGLRKKEKRSRRQDVNICFLIPIQLLFWNC